MLKTLLFIWSERMMLILFQIKRLIFKDYNPSVVLRDEYKETKEQARNAQITT
jgi:hypothetical protein